MSIYVNILIDASIKYLNGEFSVVARDTCIWKSKKKKHDTNRRLKVSEAPLAS